MNLIIIILTLIGVILGIYLSIHNLIETRKKYYTEYLKRKKNGEA
jgi:hypothetical protein